MLAAQLLSPYNEETNPREKEKWVNLCLEEVRNGARQKPVPGGFCHAARHLPEQPGLEDEGHPSDAFREGSRSTAHPGTSPGASGKGRDAASTFGKLSGAVGLLSHGGADPARGTVGVRFTPPASMAPRAVRVGALPGCSNDLLHIKLSGHVLLKLTPAAGGLVRGWAVHWSQCSHQTWDGAEGCACLGELSSPAFSRCPFA